MDTNRRIETMILMVVGVIVVIFSINEGRVLAESNHPPQGWEWFAGFGILSGSLMLCVGAVLDYLHQRNRSM
jgi:hypothetical protein